MVKMLHCECRYMSSILISHPIKINQSRPDKGRPRTNAWYNICRPEQVIKLLSEGTADDLRISKNCSDLSKSKTAYLQNRDELFISGQLLGILYSEKRLIVAYVNQ